MIDVLCFPAVEEIAIRMLSGFKGFKALKTEVLLYTMMNAFFMYGYFQVINSIGAICNQVSTEQDIYLIPIASDWKELAEKLRKTGLFREVKVLPNILLTYPVTIKKIISITMNRFKVYKMLKDKKYERVYYNADGLLVNSIIYSGLIKNNQNAKHIFIENGPGIYIRPYDEKPRYLHLFIRLLGMKCMEGKRVDEILLYEPEIMCTEQPAKVSRLTKIDRENPEVQRHLNTIYPLENTSIVLSKKKYILLEQAPYALPFDEMPIWEAIVGGLDKQDIILKLHPRQKKSKLGSLGLDVFPEQTIPLEAIIAGLETGSKVFFSMFSTACLLPKLMLDEDTQVVFLYKLAPADFLPIANSRLNDFIENFKGLYNDSSRLHVPGSIEELKAIVEKIRNQ